MLTYPVKIYAINGCKCWNTVTLTVKVLIKSLEFNMHDNRFPIILEYTIGSRRLIVLLVPIRKIPIMKCN